MMQRWVTEYQKTHPEVQIDYQSIGSGGGVKGFLEKTLAFGASDAPLTKKEFTTAGGADKVVQIPIVAGAIVAGYNLPGFSGQLKLDGPVLAEIYMGKITKWNDAKIKALNPGVTLPDIAVTPVHRTDASGTTYIYTSYLATQSVPFKETVGAAKQVEWPGGAGGKGNEGVTQVVQSTRGAVGYIELAYAEKSNVPFALMKNHDGQFIKASPESTSAAGEGALKSMDANLAADLWNQPGKEVYPIAGFTYVTVYKDMGSLKDATAAAALADFLYWTTHDGQKLAGQLDYAPLSAGVQARVATALKELRYSGKPVLAMH
jgi:phosphate transport system substrate-binding protein